MKPPEPASLLSLLEEARLGSTQAIGRLLELCRPYLLRVANQELTTCLQAKAGASDLVQEAFLEAQKVFARFEGATPRDLLAWLRGILLNKVSEFVRRYRDTDKRQVGREAQLADGVAVQTNQPSPSELAVGHEEDERVRQAVATLPEHYRQVLLWRQWEQLSFEEIGTRLGRTSDAARMLWWRALERLQQELGLDDAAS